MKRLIYTKLMNKNNENFTANLYLLYCIIVVRHLITNMQVIKADEVFVLTSILLFVVLIILGV